MYVCMHACIHVCICMHRKLHQSVFMKMVPKLDNIAQPGEIERALDLFNDVVFEANIPDVVTFLVLLSSCNHVGRVEEGQCVLMIWRMFIDANLPNDISRKQW